MKNEINICTGILREGGCILYPTDTVWGIGCDATNPDAVARVYNIKQREDTKAMLVLADSIEMLGRYVDEIPAAAMEILEVNESPLTIVYPGARGLAGNLIPGDGSIGIRITADAFSSELIRAFGKPVVSSSANIAGDPAPSNFSEIQPAIKAAVDHVVNWRQGEGKKGKPSGVLKVSLNGEIEIIRK
jgi:L-threonylcarbamoyladenylate synthase